MRIRRGLAILAVSAAMTTAAFATPMQDQVTQALVAQGYEVVMVHRTLLGRVRIVAETAGLCREIVINPYTGEVLRDYSVMLVTADDSRSIRDRGADRPSRPTVAASPSVSALEAVADPVTVAGPDN